MMTEEEQKFRDHLIEIILKNHEAFEKQLSYISSGSIGASILIVDKVIPDFQNSEWNELMIIGWLLMGLVLIFNMLGMLNATRLFTRSLKELGTTHFDPTQHSKRIRLTVKGNFWLAGFLCVGIFLFIFFISKNM